MPTSSTRQRLTQAALELFLSQGISQTTTRQIADMAGVNEVTLFRNFGNKYGLLLAMLQEAPAVVPPAALSSAGQSPERLRAYASEHLHVLEQFPNFVRSVIGEADQYPPEHQQAFQQRLSDIKQDMAAHLDQLLEAETTRLPTDDLASFLAALLVGYIVIETTTGYALWDDRDTFLDALVTVLLENPGSSSQERSLQQDTNTPHGRDLNSAIAVVEAPPSAPVTPETLIFDLPTAWVHQMLKQARTVGFQDYALAYVLFGAGLLPEEVIQLQRAHQICDKSQHVLQVMAPSSPRQVPVNQWILGKRYGSYTSNPLTKWLKTRKDHAAALFVDEASEPMTVLQLQVHWERWWQGIDVGGLQPQPHQARQTWCVEMLMRGMSLENLSILTGCEVSELSPYAQRAKEKAAIAAATQLDRKTPSNSG
ncbi:MAG: TetR family transcriptional regulator [Leptolyngbya sp. SIO1D8]|nr:TetR family transcriptional regulator [Leptolyngbya sp. SIO1D8]